MNFDINRCRRAMQDIYVQGIPDTGKRIALIEEAIKRIQEAPNEALTKNYLGIKNYASFGDQREDHPYGCGPRHGYIVFSINRSEKSTSLGDDHIYLLECVRDAGTAREIEHQNRRLRYNLCDAIREYDRLKLESDEWEKILGSVTVESMLEQCA